MNGRLGLDTYHKGAEVSAQRIREYFKSPAWRKFKKITYEKEDKDCK
jgi:hypothetical protein